MFLVDATITKDGEKYQQIFRIDGVSTIDEATAKVLEAPTSTLVGEFYGKKQGIFLVGIEYHMDTIRSKIC